MKRLLLLAALAAGTPAHAFTPMDCAGLFCTPRTVNPSAQVLGIAPEMRDLTITDEDRASWATRCKPRKYFDGLTVRWAYAEAGCSVGPMHLE